MAEKTYHFFLLLIILFQFQISTLQEQISTDDLNVLREIKTALSNPSFFSSWNLASQDPCSTFSGLTCSLNRVDSLLLGTNLTGTLTLIPSLHTLTELTQFIISPGLVTGPIPSQLGSLKNLKVISFSRNKLTGSIPKSLFSLPELHTLDLSYNLLTGVVPPVLTSLNRLKVFDLSSNGFFGAIPKTLPPQLLHLDFRNNRFSGGLPKRMPLSIRYFSVSSNELVGPVDHLVSLSELVYLDLSMNKFSGSVPGLLFQPTLSTVLLQRNNFSGTLPFEFPTPSSFSPLSLYGPGSIVDLSHNVIAGELSPVLACVETIYLNNNRLTGIVPAEYLNGVTSGRTTTLFLQHNFLSGIPVENFGKGWPESATVCASYNCMVPPVEMTACPDSAGEQISRPMDQCTMFKNGSYIIG